MMRTGGTLRRRVTVAVAAAAALMVVGLGPAAPVYAGTTSPDPTTCTADPKGDCGDDGGNGGTGFGDLLCASLGIFC